MTSGIPFIKIADRVEVTVNLKAKRVSGPKQFAEATPTRYKPGIELSKLRLGPGCRRRQLSGRADLCPEINDRHAGEVLRKTIIFCCC